MALAPHFKPLFSRDDCAAGEGLVDAVYITSTSRADQITAFVRGAPSARIEIKRTGRKLALHCRCEAPGSNRGRCEHAWALLCYLDRSEPEIVEHLEGVAAEHLEALAGESATSGLWTPRQRKQPAPSPSPSRDDTWEVAQQRLNLLAASADRASGFANSELVYIFIHPDLSRFDVGLELQLGVRKLSKSGKPGAHKVIPLARQDLAELVRNEERSLVDAMLGRGLGWSSASPSWYREHAEVRLFQLRNAHDREIVRATCATGRALVQIATEAVPVHWSDEPCELRLVVSRRDGQAHLHRVVFRSGKPDTVDPPLPCGAGVALRGTTFLAFDDHGAGDRLERMFLSGPLVVPEHRAPDLVANLLSLASCPPLELPEDLRFRDVTCAPVPEFAIESLAEQQIAGELGFFYDDVRVGEHDTEFAVVVPERRTRCARDFAVEEAFRARLRELGFKVERESLVWVLPRNRLAGASRVLLAEGWRLLANKKALVPPGEFVIKVSSGIDWFDLDGQCKFGSASISIKRLFAANQRESGFVELGDGTFGIVPEAWLAKHEALHALGESEPGRDTLRFSRARGVFLDALLTEREQVQVDTGYAAWREGIERATAIVPREPPDSFRGELRPYQKEALGWFAFLRELGFSGCLADDMGLGKTVQVLAMLEDRRCTAAPGTRRTSLVVAPRSLVFHWQREAQRFAPGLAVLDFARADRQRDSSCVRAYDLVLTTYGTLRRDVELLAEIEFDYAVLDEAQAIKNASSQAAKSARLLRAEHRLALSGTPVENHVGELVSLFDFLNPNLLTSSPAVLKALRGATGDPQAQAALARALRPFLLRRTKQQVAKDLPERVEETLWCELGESQRRFYDDVKETVRAQVLDALEQRAREQQTGEAGIGKALATVLTSLLRLRQAACDPRLVDARRKDTESCKLDILLERLGELREERQKTLVFSQFTSLLTLVKERLAASGIAYEYLDGATHDRAARVDHFQNDPDVGVFLISLKAGGLGLNLTAASYVFLLDPWWNPASEAQAIDRAHRIGQQQRVIAYRMIARDTIEERILELQSRKRTLADAILCAESGPLAKLTREDLELLFE